MLDEYCGYLQFKTKKDLNATSTACKNDVVEYSISSMTTYVLSIFCNCPTTTITGCNVNFCSLQVALINDSSLSKLLQS